MEIDGITYEHRDANFIMAKTVGMKLMQLLKGNITLSGSEVNIDIGGALANIGTPDFAEVEKFVLKFVTVTDESGTVVHIDQPDVFNAHFNKHKSHYFQLVIDGLKFHFAGFLPAGLASKVNTLDLDNLNLV
jgi:Ni,Fe-hydrogenase maturation factor